MSNFDFLMPTKAETPTEQYVRMSRQAVAFSESYEVLRERIRTEIVRHEYGTDSILFRGCYGPSLLNRLNAKSEEVGQLIEMNFSDDLKKARYGYGLDKEGRVIYAGEMVFRAAKVWVEEFIFYQDDYEVSAYYKIIEGEGVNLEFITESVFENGRKKSFSFFKMVSSFEILSFEKEIYTYEDGKIVLIDRYDYFIDKRKEKIRVKALIQDKYEVYYDGDKATKCTFRRGTPKSWERENE